MKAKLLPDVMKLYSCLSVLKPYQKLIDDAKLNGDKEAERKNILKATTLWSKSLCEKFGLEVEVVGKENLQLDEAVMFAGNHQSAIDPLIMYRIIDTVAYGTVSKKEIMKIPAYNKWMERINCVFLDRGNAKSSLQSISKAVNLIKDGFSILVFPEGTRSKGVKMGEMKPGAFKIATRSNAPVVPFSINGTFKLYEDIGKIIPGKVYVKIHPPVKTEGLSKEKTKELPSIIQKIVDDGVKELNDLFPLD